ncbi:MAG TPA: DUF5915 domain-containing protein [Dehalococcoidia bacterium]|nr:DUF5915 domain-containing protein [Dehalococcoidia bacterium]
MLDELNVKQLSLGGPPSIKRIPVLNLRILGPKLGSRLPAVQQALRDATDSQSFVIDWQGLTLTLPNSEKITLSHGEYTVKVEAAPGWVAEEDSGYLVGFPIIITPELAQEGLARELVHRLQTMRRTAGFDIADTIETWYEGDADIAQVVAAHQEYIRQETLSRALTQGRAEGGYAEELTVDGHTVRLTVKKT